MEGNLEAFPTFIHMVLDLLWNSSLLCWPGYMKAVQKVGLSYVIVFPVDKRIWEGGGGMGRSHAVV